MIEQKQVCGESAGCGSASFAFIYHLTIELYLKCRVNYKSMQRGHR